MGRANRKKEDLNIPVMIFCILGVVLTVFGFMLAKNGNFRLNVLSTEGTVTGVNTSKVNGEIVGVGVNLSYNANKTVYTASIANYGDENVQIGDKIQLYYDFLEPSSVDIKRSGYVAYISLIVGIILCIKTLPRFVRIIRDNYI